MSLIVGLAVHAVDVQDRDGAEDVLADPAGRFGRLGQLWADGGYAGDLGYVARRWQGRVLMIVKRTDPHPFAVLPK